MRSLFEIYNQCGGDKGTVHSYIGVYESILAPYRDTAHSMLEIGVFHGESLRMWEQYFSSAKVVGVDLNDHPHDFDLKPMIAEGTHNLVFLDASNSELVESAFADTYFDVIIEDASHALVHQFSMYENFRTHLSPGGIYIIEDVADIDTHRQKFMDIDPSKSVEIIDRRHIKDRFDDVLIVIR